MTLILKMLGTLSQNILRDVFMTIKQILPCAFQQEILRYTSTGSVSLSQNSDWFILNLCLWVYFGGWKGEMEEEGRLRDASAGLVPCLAVSSDLCHHSQLCYKFIPGLSTYAGAKRLLVAQQQHSTAP